MCQNPDKSLLVQGLSESYIDKLKVTINVIFQGMINRGVVPEGYPYYGGIPPGAPIHPQLGVPGQQAYMAGAGNPNMPVHPGQFPGHTGMNVQPLRGEQQYNRQPLPQFSGAQPQNQFGQARPQFGQPPQYANVPQQQQPFGGQQQQNFDRGQPQQQQKTSSTMLIINAHTHSRLNDVGFGDNTMGI